ncbi:MAG TPA: hypothetical protein P5161_07155, partial [Eubacteriales bacterium]|nr:hypothetical protein [Eubacteriales bacterium]
DFGQNQIINFDVTFAIEYELDAAYIPVEADETVPSYNLFSSYFPYDPIAHAGYTKFYYLNEAAPDRSEAYVEVASLAAIPAGETPYVLVVGSYRQDNYGTFKRRPHDLSAIIDGIVGMDSVASALSGIELGGIGLSDFLARLGFTVAINDPIHRVITFRLFGSVNLAPLNIYSILTSGLETTDIINKLLSTLELGVEISSANHAVMVYYSEGTLYVDMEGLTTDKDGIGGPSFKLSGLNLIDLIIPPKAGTPIDVSDATATTSEDPAEEPQGIDMGIIGVILSGIIDKIYLNNNQFGIALKSRAFSTEVLSEVFKLLGLQIGDIDFADYFDLYDYETGALTGKASGLFVNFKDPRVNSENVTVDIQLALKKGIRLKLSFITYNFDFGTPGLVLDHTKVAQLSDVKNLLTQTVNLSLTAGVELAISKGF